MSAPRQLLLSSLWRPSGPDPSMQGRNSSQSDGLAEGRQQSDSQAPDRRSGCEEDETSEPHAVCRRRSADSESASDHPSPKRRLTAADDYDVSLAVGAALGDDAKRRWVSCCERHSSSFAFPVREEYGYQRRFKHEWLAHYPWLRFSVKENGGYCLPCVLFGKGKDCRGQLVTSALTTFSRAASALRRHAGQKSHCLAVTDQESFLAITEKGTEDVRQQLVSVDAQRRADNRAKLRVIIDAVLFCARQNLALRGHREPSNQQTFGPGMAQWDCNPGNFLSLLDLMARNGCTLLQQHFHSTHGATYTSPQIQNQLINCTAEVIRSDIVADINAAGFYSILADEGTDISNREQLAFVIRYVKDNAIQEDFIDFLECESTTGEHIATTLLQHLHDIGLSPNALRGQGYDGAANMAGKHRGVAARITQQYPKAKYVHCCSHVLNLCVVATSEVPAITRMWATMKEVFLFFDNSPQRSAHLRHVIKDKQPESRQTKLVSLSKTRWVARIDALSTFAELYSSVCDTFQSIAENAGEKDWNPDSRSSANSLLLAITSFDFLFPFRVAKEGLAHTRALTVALQKKAKDVCGAYSHIESVTAALSALREDSDHTHQLWFDAAAHMASAVNAEPCLPRACRRGLAAAEDVSAYYRRTVTVPFLDNFLRHLHDRFAPVQQLVTSSLSIVPSAIRAAHVGGTALAEALSTQLLASHGEDLPSFADPAVVKAEVAQWCQLWKNHPQGQEIPDSPQEALQHAATTSGMYPNISRVMQLICTLPVVTCECERNISALRRLKTFLRSTTGQERLSSLALIHVHYKHKVDLDRVVNLFAAKFPRRMALADILQDEA